MSDQKRLELDARVAQRTQELVRANQDLSRQIAERGRTEEVLRESETRFRALTELSSDWYWRQDENLRFTYMSPHAEEIRWQSPVSSIGRTRWELPDTLPLGCSWEEHKAALAARQTFRDLQLVRIGADGNTRYLEISGAPIFDDQGGFRGYHGTGRDITERKRTQDALRESEQRYRTLFDSIDEGFCTIEVLFDENAKPADYRFLQINPSFERQTGIENAVGRRMREIAPRHEEHWFEIYGGIALTGEPMRFENEARQLGRWYDVYAFRVEDPELRRVGILFNDITERKRAEEELRLSQHYLAEAQRLSHIGSWAFGAAGFSHWSPELFKIHGLDPGGKAPSVPEYLALVHPEDRDFVVREIQRMLASGEGFDFTKRIVRPDGAIRHVRCVGVRAATGGIGREFTGTGIDVTELKRAEDERREHLWFLESMDRINRAMQRTNDLEVMTSGVLEEALTIFHCDRARVVYPADPNVATYRVVMEQTRPEYPSAIPVGKARSFDAEMAEICRRALDAPGAVADAPVPAMLRELSNTQALLLAAIRPKGDRPYLLVLHQCSQPRAWTASECRLFEEIARRLEDALTSVLAHRNLLASEERYARAMEGSDAGHWDWNIVTDEMFLSARAREMLALAPGELPARRAEIMERVPMHPDDRAAMSKVVKASVQSGIHERDYRVMPRPGEVRWLHSRAKVYKDARGAAVRMTGSLADITERKLAAERLRESEERFRDLTEISSDFYWETDAEHRYTSIEFGKAYVGMRDLSLKLGRTRWEIPSRIASPTPDEAGWAAHRAVCDAREPIVDFGFSRMENGVERFYEINGEPRFDARGGFLGYRGVGRDVTGRKRAEEARRLSEERYSLALQASEEGHFDHDIDTDELFISERMNELFGFPPRTRFESREEWMKRVRFYGDDGETYRVAVRAAVADGGPDRYEFEYRILRPSGEMRWLRTRAKVTRNAEGRAIRRTGVVADITERKRAEEERREHLWFLECMDRVNRAMQRTNDVEHMMSGVLEETLAIFGCDRSWLVYPCDPDAATARVVMEHTNPEYPGAFGLGEEFPVNAQAAEVLRRLLDGPGAVTDWSVQPEIRERFSVQSIIGIAVRPKGDRPYLFGLHQCSHARSWTAVERRLFEEIARRLEDALTSVLAHRNLLAREEALRSSEAYLAEAQTLSQTGSWAWSPDQDIRYWSEECYRVLSFDPQDGLPRFEQFFQRIHPDDQPGFRELIETAIREKGEWKADYRIVHPGGAVRDIHVVGHPVLSTSGHLVEFVGTVIDVTEPKRAEEERKEHLWFLESMDRVNRAMQRTNDVEGVMRGVLEETLAIFGSDRARLVYPCDPDTATCRVVMEHSRPEYPGAFARGEELPMDQHSAEFVRRVLDSPGAARDLSIPPEMRERFGIQSAMAIAVRPKGDRPYLFGLHQCSHARIWTDAERRLFEEIARRLEDALTSVLAHRNLLASEEQLRRSRAYLAEAQRVSHTGSWAWNNVTRQIVYWSEECFRIHGRDPAQGQPSLEDILADIHPDDVPGIVASLEPALREGREWEGVYRLVNFAEGPRTVRSIAHPVPDASGRVVEYIGTVMDITAQKRAEDERSRLEKQLRLAQRLEAMGTLAGGIAHDFNNILGAILGFGEMARRGAAEGSRLQRDLDSIMTAGERGRALVDRVLAFSRSGVGERAAVHVEKAVREALELIAGKLPANVRIEAELRAGQAAMLGDPTQIHQVMMNLATNALHAMPAGGTLRVRLATLSLEAPRLVTVGTVPAGELIVLTVSDTGMGIPPEVVGRIFDPFFTTKEVGVGTGLGLSLVHGLVTEAGGGVDVASVPGQGSTFTVYLPRAGDAAEAGASAPPDMPRGDRECVLVVDDEEPLVRLATRTLEELGYAPVGFTSSAAALEAFRLDPQRFDAVITDERMPGVSGTALIREVRGVRSAIPVLLMSGYVGGGVASQAREAGANAVLKKPLLARELATSLARVFQRH